jgi:hypothetical protein
MSNLKRIAALITFIATAFTVITPTADALAANDGPRVHCC